MGYEAARAIRMEGDGLTVSIQDGALVVEWSEECIGCRLEKATQPDALAEWGPSKVVPAKKGGRFRAVFPVEPASRYFRLRAGSER